MKRSSVLFLVAVSLLACSPDAILRNIEQAPEVQLVKYASTLLFEGDFTTLKNHLTPESLSDSLDSTLQGMREELPAGDPVSVQLVGYRTFRSNERREVTVILEYAFPSGFLWVKALVVGSSPNLALHGFRLERSDRSLEEINQFTFAGKSPLHFAVLIACILVPIFSLLAFVVCIRSAGFRRRWLWLLFILVGVGKLSLNWTTGAVSFQPISVQLFGASYFSFGQFAPWVLSVSVPLGGILFLVRRPDQKLPTSHVA